MAGVGAGRAQNRRRSTRQAREVAASHSTLPELAFVRSGFCSAKWPFHGPNGRMDQSDALTPRRIFGSEDDVDPPTASPCRHSVLYFGDYRLFFMALATCIRPKSPATVG